MTTFRLDFALATLARIGWTSADIEHEFHGLLFDSMLTRAETIIDDYYHHNGRC